MVDIYGSTGVKGNILSRLKSRWRALRVVNRFKSLTCDESGVAIFEVLVALPILGLVGVVFLCGLSTVATSTIVANERTNAESLATSQMEYIQGQSYSTDVWNYTVTSSSRSSSQQPSWWSADAPPLLDSHYAGYSVSACVEHFDFDGDGTIEVPGDDNGIRKITVNVYRPDTGSDAVITLESYKVSGIDR